MTMDSAHAAGQGGTEPVPAPQSSTEPALPSQAVASAPRRPQPRDDEAYRRLAVEELTLHLARGGALLRRCEEMAELAEVGEYGAILAAARLMNANAQLAKALAQVALVERRSRTIVETIQRPDPKIAGLNSSLPPLLKNQEIRAVLERGLRLLLEQQRQEQPPPEALAIACRI
jgi:hypothetical protein